jgi:hypothetical protein
VRLAGENGGQVGVRRVFMRRNSSRRGNSHSAGRCSRNPSQVCLA